jgi:hypothetical protein
MQAGEKLSFIRPFTGERSVDDKESEDINVSFLSMCIELLSRYKEAVRFISRAEVSGTVEVFEGSYKVDSVDGSYLHIVVYGHQDSEGVIDAGVSVVEHTDEGVYRGGYVYAYGGGELIRDTCHPETVEDPEDTTHFSLIGSYAAHDELQAVILLSEDEEDRNLAIEIDTRLREGYVLSAVERDLGYDQQPPEKDELVKLQSLLRYAQPFTPPVEDVE